MNLYTIMYLYKIFFKRRLIKDTRNINGSKYLISLKIVFLNNRLIHLASKKHNPLVTLIEKKISKRFKLRGYYTIKGFDEVVLVVDSDKETIKDFVASINNLKEFKENVDFISLSAICYEIKEKVLPEDLESLIDTTRQFIGENSKEVVFYTDEILDKYKKIEYIKNNFIDALIKEEIQLYYQPKFNVFDERIAGLEALSRWFITDGPYKFISPGEFIPVIEENGEIITLDWYVLKSVCKMLKSRIDLHKKVVPVSLNFSQKHNFDTNFVNRFIDIVDSYNIPHNLIEMEITESCYSKDYTSIIEVANNLRSKGFLIALDDFGKGYSNLYSLSNLPLDVLKIDQNLFECNFNNVSIKYLYSTIINFAKKINTKVVVEGVETLEQLKLVSSLGGDMVQGYYFSKPLSIEKFDEFMRENEIHKKSIGVSYNEDEIKDLPFDLLDIKNLYDSTSKPCCIFKVEGDINNPRFRFIYVNTAFADLDSKIASDFEGKFYCNLFPYDEMLWKEKAYEISRSGGNITFADVFFENRNYLVVGLANVAPGYLMLLVDESTIEPKHNSKVNYFISNIDDPFNLFYYSRGFKKLLGYHKSDYLDRSLLKHINKIDLQEYKNAINSVRKQGNYSSLIRFTKKNGENVWMTCVSKIRNNAQGELYALTLVFDISSSIMPLASNLNDINNNLVQFNTSFSEIYIYSLERKELVDVLNVSHRVIKISYEQLKRDFERRVIYEDRKRFDEFIRFDNFFRKENLKNGYYSSCIIFRQTKGDDFVFIEVDLIAKEDDKDNITIMIRNVSETLKDLTQDAYYSLDLSKKADDLEARLNKLQIKQDRYVSLLKDSPFNFYFYYDGKKDIFSYSYLDEAGVKEEKIVTDYLKLNRISKSDVIYSEDTLTYIEIFNEAIKQESNGSFCIRLKLDKNNYEWYTLTYFSLFDESGHLECLIGRSDNIQLQKNIEEKYKVDNLTKLLRRSAFDDNYVDFLINKESTSPYGVLFFEIKDFNKFNKNYSYELGDKSLKNIAQIIKDTIKDHKLTARYGGNKFVCVLTDQDIAKYPEYRTKIIEKCNKFVFHIDKEKVHIPIQSALVTIEDGQRFDIVDLYRLAKFE